MRRSHAILLSVCLATMSGGTWPARASPDGELSAAAGRAVGATPEPVSYEAGQNALCVAAVNAAEARYGTPPGLLNTISKVESGRPIPPTNVLGAWPWAVDADGAAYFFATKAAAVAWVRAAQQNATARYIDVGCMQVDLAIHPNAFRSLEDAFEPATNADYAARYLKSLRDTETGGDWPTAVGLYHSHTPMLAAQYRQRVADVGAGILTGIAGPDSLFLRSVRQGTFRLALAGGGALILNLNRQPVTRARRRLSACQIATILGPDLRSPPANCRGASR